MIHVYCRVQHSGSLCPECQDLMDYVAVRLERCHFGEDKPTCANCPVHCYQRTRRDQIKAVMRFAGPRMLWSHPWLSVCHLFDSWFRKAYIRTIQMERNALPRPDPLPRERGNDR